MINIPAFPKTPGERVKNLRSKRGLAMTQSSGKYIIIIGIIIILIGIVIMFKDSIPILRYLGRLPGDIHVKKENFSFHFPIVTCIIVSIIISLILYLAGRFR